MMSSSSPTSAITFPPAPVWFNSHSLCSVNGVVAYVAFQDIVFLWHKKDDLSSSSFPGVRLFRPFQEKDSKLLAMDLAGPDYTSSSKEDDQGLSLNLVTTNEIGVVRAWKVDCFSPKGFTEPTVYKEHAVHRDTVADTKRKAAACCWSPDSGTVYSGDLAGNIVVWDVRSNKDARVLSIRNTYSVYVIRACPHRKDWIAFGCRMGTIYVVDTLGKGKILKRVRAHQMDIQGMSWCPSPFNVFEKSNQATSSDKEEDNLKEELLLAVGSKDKTFTVWSAKTGSKIAEIGHVRRGNNMDKYANQAWSTCLWSDPARLYTNASGGGDLVSWNLVSLQLTQGGTYQGDEYGGAKYEIIHREHSYMLCSIADAGSHLVTIGKDRHVVSYDKSVCSVAFVLPAFSSWVYCIVPNPTEPRRLAIGSGDGLIKIWNTQNNKVLVDCGYISTKSNSKITAIGWSADREDMLAFGTSEGAFGVADWNNPKSVKTFQHVHSGQVYKISWGPNLNPQPREDNYERIFTVGSNKILMHSRDGSERKIDLEELMVKANGLNRSAPPRSELSFHPDKAKVVALGNGDGSVEIVDTATLRILVTLKTSSKLVQSLAWHPPGSQYEGEDADDDEGGKDYWLAIAFSQVDIHVVNVEQYCQNLGNSPPNVGEDTEDVSVKSEPDFVLSGHLQRVNEVAWSPHQAGKLLSVSYDNSVQVWDVPKQQPIANVGTHFSRCISCIWHPTDPDVVLSGSEDNTLRGWRISESTNKLPQKVSKKTKKRVGVERRDHEVPAEQEEGEEVKSMEAKEIKSESCSVRRQARGAKNGYKVDGGKAEKAWFSVTTAQGQQCDDASDCLRILDTAKKLKADEGLKDTALMAGDGNAQLKMFGSREDAAQLLLLEAESLKSKGSFEWASHVAHYHGEVGGALYEWIESGNRVTEGLVSLAMATGYDVWKTAVVAFSKQLVNDGDSLKAASYLLMINDVDEAVDCLLRGKQLRAAMTLARYECQDQKLKKVYLACAEQYKTDGDFGKAAKALVSAGEFLRASKFISTRMDSSSLVAAAILTKEAGETDRALVEQAKHKILSQMQAGDGGDVEGLNKLMDRLKQEFPEVSTGGEAGQTSSDQNDGHDKEAA